MQLSHRPLVVVLLVAAKERSEGKPRVPSSAVLRDMWFATLQRAQGAFWELIDAALGRKPGTCERWSWDYPWYWDYLYRPARIYALGLLAEEARAVLAKLPPPKPRQRRGKRKPPGG